MMAIYCCCYCFEVFDLLVLIPELGSIDHRKGIYSVRKMFFFSLFCFPQCFSFIEKGFWPKEILKKEIKINVVTLDLLHRWEDV